MYQDKNNVTLQKNECCCPDRQVGDALVVGHVFLGNLVSRQCSELQVPSGPNFKSCMTRKGAQKNEQVLSIDACFLSLGGKGL